MHAPKHEKKSGQILPAHLVRRQHPPVAVEMDQGSIDLLASTSSHGAQQTRQVRGRATNRLQT